MAKKTLGRFAISPPSTGGAKVPAMGGGQSAGIASFISMAANQQQNQQTASSIGDVMGQVKEQFPGGVPVDTNLNLGKNVSADVKLNRKLDESERKEVAGAKKYGDAKNSIISLIKKKTLDSKKGLFGTGAFPEADRTVRQMAVQQKSPLATFYDPQLQKLQSRIKELKATMFDMGGSNLSGGERSILEAPFILEGKSDEQILDDISRADQLVQEKASLVLGGSNQAQQSLQPDMHQGDDEPVDPIEAIKQRFKQRHP